MLIFEIHDLGLAIIIAAGEASDATHEEYFKPSGVLDLLRLIFRRTW